MTVGPSSEHIRDLFNGIAGTYDRANDLITLGLHRRWKKVLVTTPKLRPQSAVLDCATGTGDIAFLFEERLRAMSRRELSSDKGDWRVVGLDFSERMIEVARQRALKRGSKVEFQVADTLQLPFSDETFDVVSVSYGLRNMQDPKLALKEMTRVLKKEGFLVILETGDFEDSLFSPFLSLYTKYFVPLAGGTISGQRKAYDYLQTSSARFPSRDRLIAWLGETPGLGHLGHQTFLGGASFLYWGQRLETHS